MSKIKELFPILGGESNALTEEDPEVIFKELTDTFARQKFDVLFCDETASQSGRILPLEAVAKFCRQNSVILVVDGTQSCQLLFAKNKFELLDQVMISNNFFCYCKFNSKISNSTLTSKQKMGLTKDIFAHTGSKI
jgi:O-acetylhomoserine/O-acetylserine sulfhydrylase-like pyridoxal-dependent enzyme